MTTRLAWALALAALGCGGGQAPATAPAPPASHPAPAAAPPSAPSNGARPAGASTPSTPPAASASSSPPASSSANPAARRFPPPSIAPPYPRSAASGDGVWTPYPEGSPFVKTLIHPHESSKFIEVTIVAIDLGAVRVGYMPGTDDLGKPEKGMAAIYAPVAFTPGLVPEAERERLLAVFNGGFQPRHGHWGMKLGNDEIVPPRSEGCTLALYADGSIRLRSWPALAPTASSITAYRQTPPCLVEEGEVHPDLLRNRDKAWAGQAKDLVTRRRSAVGLDATGSLLFYAIGVEAPPRLLAEALRAAGARSGAELDINWNWTRFLLFTKDKDGKLRATTALAEGEYAKSGYVERPSERDFFYVLRR